MLRCMRNEIDAGSVARDFAVQSLSSPPGPSAAESSQAEAQIVHRFCIASIQAIPLPG